MELSILMINMEFIGVKVVTLIYYDINKSYINNKYLFNHTQQILFKEYSIINT